MAHFKVAADQEMHLTSYCHEEEDFQVAARGAGFRQVNAADVCGDDSLGRLNEKWSRHLGKPMTRIWHFRKG